MMAFQSPDSAARDTLRPPAQLPEVVVSITRHRAALGRLPAAVSVLLGEDVTEGRLTLGLDEALRDVPGVYVANRHNFSLDQRFSIRGFGSRANFGLRGVKVLLDGVPQTLPDGQSQLTNVELGTIERIEVYRGAASALYGNASGGVLSLETRAAPTEGWIQSARVEAGAFGTTKWQTWSGGRMGAAGVTAHLSRFGTDGFRDHARANAFQGSLGMDLPLNDTWSVSARVRYADAPQAENPGALTGVEVAAHREGAAPNNIARAADKSVSQSQGSVEIHRRATNGREALFTLFGLMRELENPLATPPPGPSSPTLGTYNAIDRVALGARLRTVWPLGAGAPVLMAGADFQVMRDHRVNRPAVAGVPTTDLLVDQRERLAEIGPFARLEWTRGAFMFAAGSRWDRIAFRVTNLEPSGAGGPGGSRHLAALSGQAGASLRVAGAMTTWVSLGSAFESPTTTEFVTQAGGTVGFNTDLGPQRAVTAEIGFRGGTDRIRWEVVVFNASVRDAIVQVREQDGRALFANVGRTRQRGAEIGLSASPHPGIRLHGAWTVADYTFRDYKVRNGARVDTLDGRRLPAVPRHFLRLGVQSRIGTWHLDIDQTVSAMLFADDANTIAVDGWGAGVTDLRLSWAGQTGRTMLHPFLAVNNLWDRAYVGSVTINGATGRVFEPSPGRNLYAGLEAALRIR